MFYPSEIVGYLALFAALGVGFLFVNLLVGRLVRPNNPEAEKLEIYECGEPTIGSSFVQFDIRFYVVALLFIIFDVEIAFFFPWATVFGKANQLRDPAVAAVQSDGVLTPAAAGLYQELGINHPTVANTFGAAGTMAEQGTQLAWLAVIDIVVFFAVLMVGFAYVWRRGDLDWVRAVGKERVEPAAVPPPVLEQEPALSA